MTVALYPGDIVLANFSDRIHRQFLLRVERFDDDGDPEGVMQTIEGRIEDGIVIFRADRLVACGRDEDCRGSLDLAMACAEQRWATGQVSTVQSQKPDVRSPSE